MSLAARARTLDCGYALSMWKENRYRRNPHLAEDWGGLVERTFPHFYHVGSRETLRGSMTEALLIKPGFAAPGATSRTCGG